MWVFTGKNEKSDRFQISLPCDIGKLSKKLVVHNLPKGSIWYSFLQPVYFYQSLVDILATTYSRHQ